MGFNNPGVPWSEMERVLSGRRRPDAPPVGADGGDSPAWSHKRGPYVAPEIERPADAIPYAELHAHSSYSFLDGASSPEELAEEAERLGLHALAVTDHDGFYGIVRFAEAAESLQLKTVFGAELSLELPKPQNGEADPVGALAAAAFREMPGPVHLDLAPGAEEPASGPAPVSTDPGAGMAAIERARRPVVIAGSLAVRQKLGSALP